MSPSTHCCKDFVVDKPIDMILYCPNCQMQHVDVPTPKWSNPPHRSHLCQNCGFVWRPADVCTNGVAQIKTRGKDDSVRGRWS